MCPSILLAAMELGESGIRAFIPHAHFDLDRYAICDCIRHDMCACDGCVSFEYEATIPKSPKLDLVQALEATAPRPP